MACTEQKKRVLKKRGKHGTRARKYTILFDRLPKMRLSNDVKKISPVIGKNTDLEIRQRSLPLGKVSTVPAVTQAAGLDEVMRSSCTLACRTSKPEQDVLEGARVYSIAQEKHASFYFSGTEISRLLTFVQTVDADMQSLLKKINRGLTTIQENGTSAGKSFTLAVNLHSVREYFDVHDNLRSFKLSERSSLEKMEDVTKMSTLPISATSSIFTISIERQCMVLQIICFKLNALCEQFWNTLATMSNKLVAATMSKNAPSLLLHNWHFYDIAQGYLLKHLLNSTNVASLNTMRKLCFVIITSPFPYFSLNINLRCSKNGLLTTLNPKPLKDFSEESINWSKLHEAVWISSMKESSLIDESRQTSRLDIKSTGSDILDNRSPWLDEVDLHKVYIHSDSESTNTLLSESSNFITEKRSIATVCDLYYDKPSVETVSSWNSIMDDDTVFEKNPSSEDLHASSFDFLRRKLGFAIPKIWVETNNLCLSRFYTEYINENLIFHAQAIKDQYLNQIESKEFCKVFLKSFGKTLIATILSTLI